MDDRVKSDRLESSGLESSMLENDRLERLREMVNEKLDRAPNGRQYLAVQHLYGVSALCGLIAMKRRLDVEVCRSAGLLHDLWMFGKNLPISTEEHKKHGEFGSEEAKEMLDAIGSYTADEVGRICSMIYHHNDKNLIHGEYEEALKDADTLHHYLYNSEYDRRYRYEGRHIKVLNELGITV